MRRKHQALAHGLQAIFGRFRVGVVPLRCLGGRVGGPAVRGGCSSRAVRARVNR